MVSSMVSRASYGVSFRSPFISNYHCNEDMIWDIHEGLWMASNQMRWYLKRVGTAPKLDWTPLNAIRIISTVSYADP
jgi:hypothetical protein